MYGEYSYENSPLASGPSTPVAQPMAQPMAQPTAAQPVGGLTAAQPAFGDYDDYTGRMGPDGEPERYSTMRGGDPRVRQQQELAERERRLQNPITLSSWMTGAKKDVRGLDPASQITLNPGTQYQIRDYTGKNEGQVIASGSTPEELLRLQDVARGLANQGRMADYRIEQVGGTPTGGLGQYRDPTTGEAVTLLGGDLYNSPGTKVVGDILKIAAPIALQFVPGFGTVLGTKLGLSGLAAKAAGVGLTSALGRTGAGLVTGENIGEALKAGAIGGLTSAATAGLLDKIGVDKALSGASGAKGAAVGTNFSPVPGAGGMTRIPVGALANLKSSVIPASAFSGLAPSATAPIVVTGVRNAVTPAFSQLVSGAAASGFDPFLSDNAGMVGDGTTAPEPAAAEEPGIVVTSRPYPNVDLTGGLASVPVSTLLNLGINTPTDVRLDDTEIDVEGRRIRSGRVSDVIPAATGAVIPNQPPPVVDPGDIVVTGKKDKDLEINSPFSVAGSAVPDLTKPSTDTKGDNTGDKKKDTLDKIADAATIAGLVIPAIGALAGGGKGGGTGTYTSGAGALNPIFSGKLPTPGEGGAFTVGGLGPATGPNPLAARPTADWYRYAMGPAMDIPAGMDLSGATSPYAGFGPGTLGRETFNRVTGLEVPPRPTGFEVAPSPTGDLTNRKVGETKVVDGDTYVWGGNQNGWQRQYKDPTTGETKLFSGNGATSVTSLADMLASGMATQRPANQPFFKQNLTNIPDWANTYRNWQNAMRGAGVPEAERSAAEREFMTALEQRPFGNAKELFDFARGLLDRSRRPKAAARGGPMGYSRGSSRESFAVEGPGTGRSDDIPAVLSDGEYVIDAETVALLGDGSSRAGAKKLDELRVKVRKHKGKNLAAGKFSVNAKNPEAYMRGGRI
jgi:hypothetical protein